MYASSTHLQKLRFQFKGPLPLAVSSVIVGAELALEFPEGEGKGKDTADGGEAAKDDLESTGCGDGSWKDVRRHLC